jgi:hypothetical protein
MPQVRIEVELDADVLALGRTGRRATGRVPDEVITDVVGRQLRVGALDDALVWMTRCRLSRS